MSTIINTAAKIIEEFERDEISSNPYNRYAAQLQNASKDFIEYHAAHEKFQRPQRFRDFLSRRPDLMELLAQSIPKDENFKKSLEKTISDIIDKFM